jgi:uncharacterized protein
MITTREDLKQTLAEAAADIADEQQRDIVFAAPLAVRVAHRLAERLGERDSKLTGALFGPILYPNDPPEKWHALKFRHFLEAFPDVVQVFKGPSGDMVRLLKPSARDPGDLNRRYRMLLLDTLSGLLRDHQIESIPANQLAIWMKKKMPAFNVSHLGYSSLSEWLENVPEVNVKHVEGIVRVRFSDAAPQAGLASMPHAAELRPAYFLVDSTDLHAVMHEILEAKPTQAQLPDWAKVLQYCRDRWPNFDWRCRYFMALTPAEHRTVQGLINYLQAVSFKVVKLNLQDEGSSFEELRQARAQTTLGGLEKALRIIRDEGQPGAVLVASHNAGLGGPLAALLGATDPDREVGVVGLSEKMPAEYLALKNQGLRVIDLERDCHAFKKPLNRSLGYDLEDIPADEIL